MNPSVALAVAAMKTIPCSWPTTAHRRWRPFDIGQVALEMQETTTRATARIGMCQRSSHISLVQINVSADVHSDASTAV